jgi:hypothetical protein
VAALVTAPQPSAQRLAVALLRLQQLGDDAGTAILLAGLTPDQARAALRAQTANVAVLLAAVFGEEIRESHLPHVAETSGRSPGQVTADHLELLALALAEAEGGP